MTHQRQIERKQTEQSLKASEERVRAILRAVPDSMFLLNSDFEYLECQPRSSCNLPFPPEQYLGKSIRDVFPEQVADSFIRCLQDARESGELQLLEYQRPLNGRMQYNEMRVVLTSDGKFLALVRDITERRLAEQALRERESELSASNARIRELAGKLMTAQEEERRRISRELHDDLNQRMAALTIMVSRIKQEIPSEMESLKSDLDWLSHRCIEITEAIRRISHELHPSLLDHVGLRVALKAYVTEISSLQKLQVRLTVPDTDAPIPNDVAVCLYRVVQESLRNIIKHSGADFAELTLTIDDQSAHLCVHDQGAGFDPRAAKNNGGLGLASMEERVRLLQGSFSLVTEPGCGSKVAVSIPLRKDQSQCAQGFS